MDGKMNHGEHREHGVPHQFFSVLSVFSVVYFSIQ